MMCYRDMTFCSGACQNNHCPRLWSDELQKRADEWWKGMDGDAPVAFSDFTDTCPDYIPTEKADES